MIHEKYQQLMQLFFANEADDVQKDELKLHLLECTSCKSEFDEYKRLMDLISKSPIRKVTDRMLDDARGNLRDRLRIETREKTFLQNIIEKSSRFLSFNYKYVINSTVTMTAGLVLGFFLFGDKSEVTSFNEVSASEDFTVDESSQIRNIRLIDPDPGDDEIEFMFDEVKQVHLSGKLQDENIKNVLMHLIMNGKNPGVRLNSLYLLNAGSGEKYDSEIKDAIISAVKYDENPGVRREALKQLKSFPFDQDVKRSYLYVILNDTSSALRIEAINELSDASSKGTSLNQEELKIFKDQLLQDNNDYIRFRARTVLEGYNL